MKILKSGYICGLWYGECNNCKSIIEASREDFHSGIHPQQVIKANCPFCSVLMKFHREDTTLGDNIRLSVLSV